MFRFVTDIWNHKPREILIIFMSFSVNCRQLIITSLCFLALLCSVSVSALPQASAASLSLSSSSLSSYAVLDTTEDRLRHQVEEAKIRSKQAYSLTIQNVDIKRFPEVSLIVEAMNDQNEPLDTIEAKSLTVVENGIEHQVISVKKISVKERVPVDFVFVLDITGGMDSHIKAIRENIKSFATRLVSRGIDYRLGLVLFSDVIENFHQPTSDVYEFLSWFNGLRCVGGGFEPENALEGLNSASKLDFRPSANKVFVLISDAPYHESTDKSKEAITAFTTETIVPFLKERSIRTFCIVPTMLRQYYKIAEGTRGSVFDLYSNFGKILDLYSTQLTNLFAITYRSDTPAIPDSINVAILNDRKIELLRKTIPVAEIGRKLIIEDLLFPSGSAMLPDSVSALNLLTEFLRNQPKVIVRIEGHTDNKGNPISNKKLSYHRAESVRSYLVSRKGIDGKRVQVVGFGDLRPIADNSTEFGRRLNRRTEVVIVSK